MKPISNHRSYKNNSTTGFKLNNNYCPLESQEQKLVIDWLELNQIPFQASANGELRKKISITLRNGKNITYCPAGKKLKKMGVKPGFPDIQIFVSNKNYPCLFVEMKRIKGGSISENQKKWHSLLLTLGFQVIIGYGAEDAIEKIKVYLRT